MIEIINTIIKDWGLLVLFFTAGGTFAMTKAWFKKLDDTLAAVGSQHDVQNVALAGIHAKLEAIEVRLDDIERTTDKIHDELHEAEVQLAVLQNTRDINDAKQIRRPRRKTG
jgi:DNA repair exonuclease SbcCD ATPase subunit